MFEHFVYEVSWNVLVSPLNVTKFDIEEPGKNISAETAQKKHAALKLHLLLKRSNNNG